MAVVICPECNKEAEVCDTRFGERHNCCGMHSWRGKPLCRVTVIEERKKIYKNMEEMWKGRRIGYKKKAIDLLMWHMGKSEKNPLDFNELNEFELMVAMPIARALGRGEIPRRSART